MKIPALAELRREFPVADHIYARRHGFEAQAVAYNAARRAIDPADATTVERARNAKRLLMQTAA